MADTQTPNLQLTNQTEGGNDNTWGVKVDDNFELIDDKLGDLTTVSTTGGTTTLTDDQQDVAAIKVNGTLVSNATIEFDGRGGVWVVWNNTAGAFTVTCKVTGQTGVAIAQGVKHLIWCDGTDIRDGVTASDLLSDTSPQLGADLDANSFSIQFDDATGIEDDSGNEQIRFQKTTTAVNQIDVTNAATGGAPSVKATGDDSNVNLELAGQGTGGVVATFTNTGVHILDTDASHDLIIKPGSNLGADRTLTIVTGDADRQVTVSGDVTLPAGTALVAANNLSDVSSAATARTNLAVLGIANNLSDLNSASTARSNLGLGTIATQAAASVSITGGTVSGVAISDVSAVASTGVLTANSGTAPPAGGSTSVGFKFTSTSDLGIFVGSGVPSLSAAGGSIYLRTDGSETQTFYIRTGGLWLSMQPSG